MTDTRHTDARTEDQADARRDDRELLAYLHGELGEPAEGALRRRLDREPALARRLRSLEGTWQALELPPVAPPPLGFAARVAARAAEGSEPGEGAAAFRPAWVRLAGAAVLAAGIAAGAGLGLLVAPEREPDARATTATTTEELATNSASAAMSASSVSTLAEAYWSAFGEDLGGSEAVR